MTESSDAGAAAAARSEKRADRRHTLITALVAGGLAIAASLGTTYVQLSGATATQEAQFNEDRVKEDRALKTDAYLKFLTAADGYALLTAQARNCVFAARDAAAAAGNAKGYTLPASCTAKIGQLASKRSM